MELIPLPIALIAIALIRPLTAIAVLPVFSKASMPAMVRNSVGIALCLPAIHTLTQNPQNLPSELVPLMGITIKEALLGLCLGYLMGGLFWAAENVGHVIDMQTGLTMSSLSDPFSGNQSSVNSPFLLQFFIALFIAAGGLRVFLELIYTSYAIWPLNADSPSLSSKTADFFIERTGDLFLLTLLIAAPIILVLNVLEITLALLGRSAPTLQIYQVVSPIKGWIASLILIFAMTSIVEKLIEIIGGFRPLLHRLSQVL